MLNENLEIVGGAVPKACEKCGSAEIKYNGIGEYQCSRCGFIMYDDYGIVRNYLEANPGATQAEVVLATGISKNRIRQLLREDKIQIAPNSAVFLHCDKCGAEIRSGKYCDKCRVGIEASEKHTLGSRISGGFARKEGGGLGAKRFTPGFRK